jgi:hypothetical protein
MQQMCIKAYDIKQKSLLCRDILNKQNCLFIFKNGDQESKIGPVWGLISVRGEKLKESVKKGECSGTIMYSCMKMEKWDMLKLFQEWEEGR